MFLAFSVEIFWFSPSKEIKKKKTMFFQQWSISSTESIWFMALCRSIVTKRRVRRWAVDHGTNICGLMERTSKSQQRYQRQSTSNIWWTGLKAKSITKGNQLFLNRIFDSEKHIKKYLDFKRCFDGFLICVHAHHLIVHHGQ